ncbi:MAG TPA: NrfD/PsrC family molybdoenzyme membrane anchor subunit [Myxococcales bacterium]|nr:NrfD/PsrC family molybdoenzyme membrane anchor subunit [Myxococcales bacterium]
MKAQRDGRDIDPAVGVLRGEGALQRVKHLGPERPMPGADRLRDSTSETDTYYGLPALKEPVWRASIPAYFYVGGLAGAAAVLSAAAQLGGDPRLRGLVRRGRLLALGGAAVSGGLLIEDLGRPARFLAMLRIFRPSSPMSVGTWVLSAFGAAAAAAALPQALGAAGARPSRAIGAALEQAAALGGIAAGLLGMPLCGYTGVLLANTAVPVWQGAHRTLPPLFVSAAASSAQAALEPLAKSEVEARVLHRFGVVGKLAELAAMRALEREVGRSPRAAAPLHRGVAGALWKSAKALTAASLALTLLPGRGRALPVRLRRWKPLAAAALATAGSLCLRFAVVEAGRASARDPRATFEPQRARLADRG